MSGEKWDALFQAVDRLRDEEAEVERIEDEVWLPAVTKLEAARQDAERARMAVGEHAPTVDELLESPREFRPARARVTRPAVPPPWKRGA